MIKKKALPLSKVYRLIEPGPVVMVTTADKSQKNVMSMSWHMMIDFEPPLIGCVISDENYTFNILKKTKECVINIPTIELISKVVGVGNTTGSKVDKFKKFNLAYESASQINVPMLSECYANLECKVIDTKMVTKYNIFILEVLKAWITKSKKRIRTIHHCEKGNFIVDGKIINVFSKKK